MMNPAQIFCIGVNHETAPLAVREGLACEPPHLELVLQAHYPFIQEWVLLSTCNRVELYVAGDDHAQCSRMKEMFASFYGGPALDLQPHIYTLTGDEATRHLLRVAAGLDSLVLGEPQILGQVNRAFSEAQERGSAGPVLTAVFRAALTSGKRVRNETAIGQNPASVPSVAINQARAGLGSLRRRTILLIGAGAMAQTAIKALRARHYDRINIANRTVERAQALVADWHGKAYDLDNLLPALVEADIVFSATHAQRALLTADLLARVQELRGGRPIMLFDLAVPRDIETVVDDLPGVTRVDLDRLQAELDESLLSRRSEVPNAEAILDEEQERLQARLAEVAIRPIIAGLRQKAEAIRLRELERTLRHLGDIDQETLAHIHHLSRALVNQLLHEPTQRLRQEANGEQPDAYVRAVRELFNLESPEETRAI